MANRIKGLSQHYLWQAQEDHLKQFYWGTKRKLWNGFYFCSTLGDVSEKIVLKYIEKQNGPEEKI